MKNPERKTANLFFILTAVAILAIFIPGLVGLDGMEGGFAISFAAFFLAICFIITAVIFHGRAKRLDRILKDPNPLAHWTYTPGEWRPFAELELKERTASNRALWLIMVFFCVLFGFLFWLFDHEGGGITFIIMIGVAVFLALFAFGLPRLKYHRHLHRPGEALITRKAAFFDNTLYEWEVLGCKLDGVGWLDAQGGFPACLVFEMNSVGRTGPQDYSLRIPVPFGRDAEARRVLAEFTGPEEPDHQVVDL